MSKVHLAVAVLAVGLLTSLAQVGLRQSAEPTVPLYVVEAFNKFLQRYNKSYERPTEKAYRLKIFFKNLLSIELHNKNQDKTYTMAVNHFADLSNEEFESFISIRGSTNPTSSVQGLPVERQQQAGLAQQANFDWRNYLQQQSITTSTGCNDNYAWVSAVNMNANYYIRRGSSNLYSFSPQTYIDCSANFGNQGCNGGYSLNSFRYSLNWGIDTLSDYPYYGVQRPCRASTGYFKNSNIYQVASLSNTDLYNKLSAKNVISAAIDISGAKFYSGGVFTGPCTTSVNQGVLLVGAGSDVASGLAYWLIMNTWGSFWGESGYMRIARFNVDGSQSYSSCGLNMFAVFPTFN